MSSRGNARFEVVYTTLGDSVPDLAAAQEMVSLLSERVRLYQEERIGSPVRFKYRLPDGLNNVPEPIIGEWSRFYTVLSVELNHPKELFDLAKGGVIEGTVAELICKPLAEGVAQPPMEVTAALVDESGFIIGRGYTNLVENPSFSNAAQWDLGWTAEAGLTTRADELTYRAGYQSAHIINGDTTDRDFTIELADPGASVPILVSAVVRRTDGGELTDLMIQLVVDGSAIATKLMQLPNTDWYIVYGYDDITESVTAGIRLEPGVGVNLDSMMVESDVDYTDTENFPTPFMDGDNFGCDWSGTQHDSTTHKIRSDCKYRLSVSNFLADFTISGWLTPWWQSDAGFSGDSDVVILAYAVDDTILFRLYYDRVNRQFVIEKEIDTVVSGTFAQDITPLSLWHFTLTQVGARLFLYLNGEPVAVAASTEPSEDISATDTESLLLLGGVGTGTNGGGHGRGWAEGLGQLCYVGHRNSDTVRQRIGHQGKRGAGPAADVFLDAE